MSDAPTNRERRKIVLLGIGHTNAHVVKEWANNPISDCDFICISNFATTTYSGMLPGTLGKQFDDNEMRINLRALLNGQPLQNFDPQSNFLKILNTGDGKALLEYGWLTVHARWCLSLKTWIDRRFIRTFQTESH